MANSTSQGLQKVPQTFFRNPQINRDIRHFVFFSGTPTLLQTFDHGTKCVKARKKLITCVDRRQYYLSFETSFISKSLNGHEMTGFWM
jgi:hypothetical protein